ncbi:MAG TPA: Ig-like domain-containing protein [Saprospiraceae bacterium]|nr:Ig-like domain-containing protein [Saprospiraceae bacterium]
MKYTHSGFVALAHPFIIFQLSVLLWIACANPIPPTGGPKDTTPPKLVLEESTPNYLTQFNQREIVLTFDEWVQLKEQNLQIVISPPLVYRPEITLKGKSVIIRFHENEVLRAQTTYLINFGASIVDINEGNILDQYKYVFSTGTFIDSLRISGTVITAATGEPAKQVLIILHDNLSDTAITNVLPAYFTKSNDTGLWTIENVRNDTFNVYALTDLNLNYRYDQVGEQIGFLGQSVFLPDTSDMRHRLVLFAEEPKLSILDVDRRNPGITKIILSGQSKGLSLSSLDTTHRDPTWGLYKDTISVWNPSQDSFPIVVDDGTYTIDTVLIHGYRGGSKEQNTFVPVKRFLHPAEALVIQSRIPLDTVRGDGILCFLSDLIAVENLKIWIDTMDSRQIRIRHQWLEQERYHLTVLPGSISDVFGSVNDTVKINFQISPRNSYGQIYAEILGLHDGLQYLVELIHPQTGVIGERIIRAQTQPKIEFDRLQPQTYQIRIIEDANANGRWDTGNLAQQRQPERVFIQALEPLRAGWDLEVTSIWEEK